MLNIDPKQFGGKIGKHAQDYGLDPSDADDRDKMAEIINDIVDNYDEIRRGSWPGQGEQLPDGSHGLGEVDFYIKGDDVVIINNGEFVSVLKGGKSNAKIIRAKRGEQND